MFGRIFVGRMRPLSAVTVSLFMGSALVLGCAVDRRESETLELVPDAGRSSGNASECGGACADGSRCVAGVCRLECASGAECAPGQVCDLGLCYGPGAEVTSLDGTAPTPGVPAATQRAGMGNAAAPGEACAVEGVSECLGSAQPLRRTCQGGVWVAGEPCASGNNCDGGSGACLPIVPACAAASEGYAFCDDAGQINVCGADRVSTSPVACMGRCVDGQCAPATCGDGATQPNEACDDGNADNTDACTNACALARCGDGFVQGAEACDDGNPSDNDGCTNACAIARCGDGVVQVGLETCDDGDAVTGDGCSALCRVEVRGVACGYYHTCALLGSGRVRCFGDNNNGDLGVGGSGRRGDEPNEMGLQLPAVDLGSGRIARQIATGYGHSCALLDDSSVKCWGMNFYGQLGQSDALGRGEAPGQLGDALPPIALGPNRRAERVFAAEVRSCAVLDDGTAKCWGSNASGRLGQGHDEDLGDGAGELGAALPAIDLGAGRRIVQLSTGSFHACALLDDQTVKCWGSNFTGQLGLGDRENRGDNVREMGDALPPVDLGSGLSVASLAIGGSHSCALFDDGRVKCWGYELSLGLGDGNNRGDDAGEMGDALPFVDLGPSRRALQLFAGVDHNCAILDDASLKCWGNNGFGQLGLGDDDTRGDDPFEMGDALPRVNLGTGRSARTVAIGAEHTCAVLDDASLKCWGRNDMGQLGLGDTVFRGDQPSEMGDALPRAELVDG
jgi:cysteine-rich repeat protein